MIKAILIIIMTQTGFVSTTVSQQTYATMDECTAAIGSADAQIAKLIENYNKSPQSDKLGKADGTFHERCMTYMQYQALIKAITPGNAKVVAEAQKKA